MVLSVLLTLLILAILGVVSGSSVYIYIYWIDGFIYLFWDNRAKLLDIVVVSLLAGYRHKLFFFKLFDYWVKIFENCFRRYLKILEEVLGEMFSSGIAFGVK